MPPRCCWFTWPCCVLADPHHEVFSAPPGKITKVVAHLGECPKSCCTPWHLKLVPSRQNLMTGQHSKKAKGKNIGDWKYGEPSPNMTEAGYYDD